MIRILSIAFAMMIASTANAQYRAGCSGSSGGCSGSYGAGCSGSRGGCSGSMGGAVRVVVQVQPAAQQAPKVNPQQAPPAVAVETPSVSVYVAAQRGGRIRDALHRIFHRRASCG